MVTTKYHSHISDLPNYSPIKFHARISSTDGNIRDWFLLNSAFINSDVTQSIVLHFCKTSEKTTFSGFLSFFRVKLSKSQSLKLNISTTAWPILMILVSFCRILNGLSDEINLFCRCSSPLNSIKVAFLDSSRKTLLIDIYFVWFLAGPKVAIVFGDDVITWPND